MDNFFSEIDEELRRERQLVLWRKYGRYIVAGALALVIVVAGVVGWRQYLANQRAEAGLAYQDAVAAAQAGRTDQALAAFAGLAEGAPDGYAELARLQRAAAIARQGNVAEAAAIYDAMAKDGGVAQPFRDLALLLYGYTALDGADPAALGERIEPLTAATSPWRYSALEIKALLARERGDEAAAQDIFKRLSDDPVAPASVRARAAEFLRLGGK